MKKRTYMASVAKVTEVSAVVIGIVTATIISALLSIGLTSLIMNGTVREAGVGPFIFIIRTISSGIGCLIGGMLIKGKYLLIAASTAFGFLAVLIGIGIVLHDGSFNNFLSGAVSVLLGAVIACVIVLKPLKKSRQTVRYSR